MESTTAIVTKIAGPVAIVRINSPAQRNSLSLQTLFELDRCLAEILTEKRKAVILTGTNDVFASGADLRELADLDSDSALEFARTGQSVFQRLAMSPVITIAAINGYCMGGGLDLALVCNIRVASRSAVFSHPGARRGIITGWGGTQRLPRIIGRTRALNFFLTAQQYSSSTALELGLVTHVSDPVLDAALEIAEGCG